VTVLALASLASTAVFPLIEYPTALALVTKRI
jgi:hypothetical protein